MLATQLNELVNNASLQPRCVVRLNEYLCNTVHGRRIVIVLDLEITGPPLAHMIGAPKNIDSVAAPNGGATTNAAAPAQSHPPQSRPFQSKSAHGSAPSSSSGLASLPEGVIPIKGLNPYQNRWTIKARVTAKSDMRDFKSSSGPKSLFSIDLLDAFSGEIRCTFFGDAAQEWYGQIQVGQVYLIGRGNVKFANKNYNTLKNDYEVSLERNPLVQLTEDDGSIPFNNFKFVDISDLREHRKDEMIDMIGAVLEVGSLEDFTSKAGNRLQKRVIKVADASNVQVMVTLWGDQAAQWNHDVRGTVILFKGVKVSDFNDRSITVLRSTKMEVEPHIPEADRVRNWFETVGKDGDVPSISNTDFMSRARGDGSGGERSNWEESRKTFAQIKKETVGKEGNAYFSVRATVTEIKQSRDHPPWYQACPVEGCNKKMTEVGGVYHCAKCGSTHDHFKPRYVLSINANDHSGSSWLTCFNDTASDILNGTTADTLLNWLSQGAQTQYDDVFQKALFNTYNLRVRASESDYDAEKKVKLNVVKVLPLDFAKESKLLIKSISKYLSI